MKIPKQLAHFKNIDTLLLVSGKQEMVIYIIAGDEIREEKHFKVENPTYSDNEGHFKVRSNGKVVLSGNVREVDDRQTIVEFKNEFKTNLKKITKDFDKVFISAPAKTKNEIVELLPPKIKKKVVEIIVGNYCSVSPLEVLRNFSQEKKKSKKIIKDPEAKKILRKSNQARKVIKGKPSKKVS
jgi:hypothetical protein